MSWAVGWDDKWKRWIGYGVPAICDHPGCNKEIDRGLAHVCCGQQPFGGEDGCGLFFCEEHLSFYRDIDNDDCDGPMCERCAAGEDPFDKKPDTPEWERHILTHESWSQWRFMNQLEVFFMRKRLGEEVGTTNAQNTTASQVADEAHHHEAVSEKEEGLSRG